VRHEVVLSKAMNGRHVRRTNPPAFGLFRSGSRGLWIAALLLPPMLAVPLLLRYFDSPPEVVEDIEVAIKKYYRHDPLTPPSRLRGPGSIYVVEEGNHVRKVCSTTEEQDKFIEESSTQDQTRKTGAGVRFALRGSIVESLNAKLSGARVESIEFGIKGATIREIAEAKLGQIEQELMSDPFCEARVDRMLAANKKVCSGYSSLTASISYKVRFARDTELTAETKLAQASIIKEAIETHGGGTVSFETAEEYSGEKLIYGILLSSSCFIPDTTPGRGSGMGAPSQAGTNPRS
jgi:hypothetical protein